MKLEGFGTNRSEEAIEGTGVVWFMPELGGGAGWFEHWEENVNDAERGIWNTMRAMQMIDGEFEWDSDVCTIYRAADIMWRPPIDGLYVRKMGTHGQQIKKGDIYGTIQDPYTGQPLTHLRASTDAVVLPDGREAPVLGATTVGILGIIDRVVNRRSIDLFVSFD